ncbi:IS3 family transposase [Robbsia andropogonis]|uniref:IS3 family transposase n=1 Tax=Robbsia andropogonis TaxID=28092 RepID=UPI002A69B4C8|nr:IS3 family transposase [Robbsia andropogonis]
MYSYEDRMRAVRLYLKLGKRVGATIRNLGYPTKKSLKSCHLEYEQRRDLRAGYARSKQVYSAEQKKLAMDHYLSHDRCVAATLRALGYPSRGTLTDWIREQCPEIGKCRAGRVAGSIPQSLAVKQGSVIELCSREGSARMLAQKVGVSRPMLYKWKNELLGREAPASMKRHEKRAPEHERSDMEKQVESLRRDIRKLELERDILAKANELLKKGMGIDLQLLSNREKTTLVDALKQTYALPELLSALRLARSSYFYHRARLLVTDRYVGARRVMVDIFECNYRCYGYRRIRAALSRQQVLISEKVVRRLMRQEGLCAATTKRRRYGSYRGEISPAPANLINRVFRAESPNQKWLTDISEFQIPAGKVYLSPVIDCFDGLVVSWSIGTRPDAELVNAMLDGAIETVAESAGRPVVHSDRGAHYRWPGLLSRMRDARLIRSMSRKGYSPDNAACEGFFGRLKTEMFYSRDWRGATVDQFIETLDAYIRWYNAKRIKVSLGSLSPLEYRASLGIVG